MSSGPVICHRISGIGDMMLHLAHCIFLGKCNEVDVYADWRRSLFVDDDDLMSNIFAQEVFHPGARPIEALLPLLAHRQGIRQAIAEAKYGSTLSEFNFANFLRSGHTPKWAVFQGALNQHDIREHLSSILADFEWSERIMRAADQIITAGSNENVIGVHYRHGNGEFSSAKTEKEVLAEIGFMVDAAFSIGQKWKSYKVLVCTDSLTAQRHFQSRFGALMIEQPKKFPPEGTGAIHYASITNGKGFDRRQSLTEALVDIELMSRCKAIIKDERSTFPMVSVAKLRRRHGIDGSVVEVQTRRLKARLLKSYSALSDALATRHT